MRSGAFLLREETLRLSIDVVVFSATSEDGYRSIYLERDFEIPGCMDCVDFGLVMPLKPLKPNPRWSRILEKLLKSGVYLLPNLGVECAVITLKCTLVADS